LPLLLLLNIAGPDGCRWACHLLLLPCWHKHRLCHVKCLLMLLLPPLQRQPSIHSFLLYCGQPSSPPAAGAAAEGWC
jgi:hypothetical protein